MLGPLLFIILINDLSESSINCIISLFADDTRLTKVITNGDDAETFQGDLEEVYSWSKETICCLMELSLNSYNMARTRN